MGFALIFARMMNDGAKRQVMWWLMSGCALIFLMVVVGGITRLTGSGLSITEWNVVMGAVPPVNEQQWQEAFDKYKQIPQYQKLNYHFGLEDFKAIFFWEYIHRLIGRVLGLVFIVPFLWFVWKRKLNGEWVRKSLLLFGLGALQGFLGWFMVKSGLTERTSVSHYRLAIHLFAAFLTFGITFWFVLQLAFRRHIDEGEKRPAVFSFGGWGLALVLVTVQIIYGAFVAGLHAGKVANTFPMMDGQWIPQGIFALSPAYINLTENVLTVQFIHRCLAYIIFLLILAFWLGLRKQPMQAIQRRVLNICVAAVALQVLLGIITLLYKAPVTLSALHQAGGFVLFSAVIAAVYFFRPLQTKW